MSQWSQIIPIRIPDGWPRKMQRAALQVNQDIARLRTLQADADTEAGHVAKLNDRQADRTKLYRALADAFALEVEVREAIEVLAIAHRELHAGSAEIPRCLGPTEIQRNSNSLAIAEGEAKRYTAAAKSEEKQQVKLARQRDRDRLKAEKAETKRTSRRDRIMSLVRALISRKPSTTTETIE